MRRRVWQALLIGVASLAAVGLVVWAVTPRGGVGAPPGQDLSPRAGARTLIFAPHPDDETLGAGGYVQQAVAVKAPVHVVVMTNGEYPELSVFLAEHTLSRKPAEFIKLGYARQRETLAAMKLFGLTPDDVTFLGYPDEYLADMWLPEHWLSTSPVRSLRTHATASPYQNAMTKNAIHCGSYLISDVTRVLRRYRPQVVITLHPNDVQVDHWATGAVVRMALAELAEGGEEFARTAQVYTYLIHRDRWPVPRAYRPTRPLDPPEPLVRLHQTQWVALPLAPEQTQRKHQAIGLYHSQGGDHDPLLRSFARTNDLFGALPALAWPPGEEVAPWVVTRDPVGDRETVTMHAGADLVSVELGREGGRLVATLHTHARPERGISYHLSLHAGAARPSQRIIAHYSWRGSSASGIVLQQGALSSLPAGDLTANGNTLIAPWPLRGDTRFFLVRAWTTSGQRVLDETAATLIRLPAGRSGRPGAAPTGP